MAELKPKNTITINRTNLTTMQNIFRDEITVDGVRMYVKDDAEGTLVVADTWDRLFKPISTGKPDLHTKGDNPNRKYLYLKGKKSYR